MSEFTPPLHGKDGYNIEQSQRFLESVGQFDHKEGEEVHLDLARNLLGLPLLWHTIDQQVRNDSPTDVYDRIYSGFTKSGDYFEIHGEPIYYQNVILYTPRLSFHANLHTGRIDTLYPDAFFDGDAMQLRFNIGDSPPSYAAGTLALDRTMGRSFLNIATKPKMPPEDFNYEFRGRREVLLDTEIYQNVTGLYESALRTCAYQPDPSYYNTETDDGHEAFMAEFDKYDELRLRESPEP